jgi:photosystem II stability/assembly factor-like uncharacterized protein
VPRHASPTFARSPLSGGFLAAFLSALMFLGPPAAQAHNPSAWGGLFRSRDSGETWFPANAGRFVSGATALAISPADVNHLLLATDSGLLRSRNGGRDWDLEAPAVLVGPVFAVAFDADGRRALASTGSGIFWAEEGATWLRSPAPTGAAPARAIVRGAVAGRVYLAGWRGLARSDDWGASWSGAGQGLPADPVTALVAARDPSDVVYAVAGGRIWASSDGARSWRPRDRGIPGGRVDAVALDPRAPDRLWATSADQLFRSDDRGERWTAVGTPLSEPNTSVRGIATSTSGEAIVLSTDRGLYRTIDGGARWDLVVDGNLPVHLEAGPLVRDPIDAATLYAGFGLTPYEELWRTAAEGGTSLSRLDPLSLAGGAAFLIVLGLGAAVALRLLARHYPAAGDAATSSAKRRLLAKTAR